MGFFIGTYVSCTTPTQHFLSTGTQRNQHGNTFFPYIFSVASFHKRLPYQLFRTNRSIDYQLSVSLYFSCHPPSFSHLSHFSIIFIPHISSQFYYRRPLSVGVQNFYRQQFPILIGWILACHTSATNKVSHNCIRKASHPSVLNIEDARQQTSSILLWYNTCGCR